MSSASLGPIPINPAAAMEQPTARAALPLAEPAVLPELPLAEEPVVLPAVEERAIEIRLFAGLRERAGWSQRRLPLPAAEIANGTAHANDAAAPLTPAALWLQLELGGGEALPPTVRVAINQAFASPHQPLVAGDELAFLPPISGG
jgi:molybdopterin synthase sulfur carrier subunit